MIQVTFRYESAFNGRPTCCVLSLDLTRFKIQDDFLYKSLNNFETKLFHDIGCFLIQVSLMHEVIDKPYLFHDTGHFPVRVSL